MKNKYFLSLSITEKGMEHVVERIFFWKYERMVRLKFFEKHIELSIYDLTHFSLTKNWTKKYQKNSWFIFWNWFPFSSKLFSMVNSFTFLNLQFEAISSFDVLRFSRPDPASASRTPVRLRSGQFGVGLRLRASRKWIRRRATSVREKFAAQFEDKSKLCLKL